MTAPLLLAISGSASDIASEITSDTSSGGNIVIIPVSDPVETISALGEFFKDLGSALLGAIPTILFAIVVLIIGMIVTKISVKLLSKGLRRTKLEITVTKFLTQMVKIVLYVLLLTIILSMLGIPSTSIITVIGTAGVAVGLALQNSLSNVAGGFLLLITKPFKVGDYIVSNGVEGVVSSISILHTRLNTHTNQAVFIPNGLAINATITNNTYNDTRRVDLLFSISYNDDFEKARGVILEVMRNNPLVLDTPEPFARMMEHGESAIVIAARAWCATENYWNVYFDITEQVRAAFIENEIEIPFNQLDVHMIK